MTFTLRWGIVGPGRIAKTFVNDLIHCDEPLRKKHEINHKLVAIGSRSVERAEQFKKDSIHEENNDEIKCYGSYDQLYKDSNVDIVYIATPNFNHFQLCYEALQHGKNVLMEKPFTINSKQGEVLANLAKSKHLFLMEAYWTKFNPVYRDIYDYLADRPIGDLKRVTADLCFKFPEQDSNMERIYNPKLGGGALLDIGIYSLYWILGFLDRDSKSKFPEVKASAIRTDTGVDINTVVCVKYGDDSIGIATSSGQFPDQHEDTTLSGTKGYIKVNSCLRPTEFWAYDYSNRLLLHKKYNFKGQGMYFEADHVGECISKGLIESPIHQLKHTIRMAQVLDESRRQIKTIYPEDIEKANN